MSARNIYHQAVRNALVKDGWTITHDPLTLKMGARKLQVDLGAARVLAAEKGEERIAVEIQSFLSASQMLDLERALGQFALYQDLLEEQEPERKLFVAVPDRVQEDVFDEPIGQLVLRKQSIRLIVFDPQQEVLLRWMP